jgi:hypothetical protein
MIAMNTAGSLDTVGDKSAISVKSLRHQTTVRTEALL